MSSFKFDTRWIAGGALALAGGTCWELHLSLMSLLSALPNATQ